MTEQTLARLEKIAALGIRILPLPEITTHVVFERDGCAVLVERHGEALGAAGGPGVLTGSGFAALVERGGEPWLIGKHEQRRATVAEAQSARLLFRDLQSILS